MIEETNTALLDAVELGLAFENEVLTRLGRLCSAALYMTRNPTDAEDLVQGTCVEALRGRGSSKPGTNIKAWLYRTLANTYINSCRKTARSPQMSGEKRVMDRQLARAASHSSQGLRSAEVEALGNTPDATVVEAMAELAKNYRLMVYLSDVEGFSYKEIATIVGTPIGTAMSRLSRGRAQLHKSLTGYAVDRGIRGARV